MADDLTTRLARIETALGAKLGVHLDDFEPKDVLIARAERLKAAGEKAAEAVKEAFVEPDLTAEQRLARIEQALGV